MPLQKPNTKSTSQASNSSVKSGGNSTASNTPVASRSGSRNGSPQNGSRKNSPQKDQSNNLRKNSPQKDQSNDARKVPQSATKMFKPSAKNVQDSDNDDDAQVPVKTVPRAAPKRSQSAGSDKDDSVDRNLGRMADTMGDKHFAEFRRIFTSKFSGGNPILAMFLALNEMSEKYCDESDERCEKVLKSELTRIASGMERATSDDMTLFSRFVNSLNDGKTATNKLFHGKGFDAAFFMNAKNALQRILIKERSVSGVQIEDDKARINLSGDSKSRAQWTSINSFIMNIIGSEKFLTERNLSSHLSCSHKITPEGMDVLKQVNPTSVTRQIMKLYESSGILPDIFQGAMVFRALGDKSKLEGDIKERHYLISMKSDLGKIIGKLVGPENKYLEVEGDNIKLPFGNVSSLVSALFVVQKKDDVIQRKLVKPEDGEEFVALAVAFRFESTLKSKKA